MLAQVLEHGFPQQTIICFPLYSISASNAGWTHVAFGFLIPCERGLLWTIRGSSFSRISRAVARV